MPVGGHGQRPLDRTRNSKAPADRLGVSYILAGVAQAVVEAVRAFSHGEAQHDDITLVVAELH